MKHISKRCLLLLWALACLVSFSRAARQLPVDRRARQVDVLIRGGGAAAVEGGAPTKIVAVTPAGSVAAGISISSSSSNSSSTEHHRRQSGANGTGVKISSGIAEILHDWLPTADKLVAQHVAAGHSGGSVARSNAGPEFVAENRNSSARDPAAYHRSILIDDRVYRTPGPGTAYPSRVPIYVEGRRQFKPFRRG